MSLQVWLPLNGNLNNQGLTDWTPSGTGTVAYVNGKTGKALSTGAVVMPAEVTGKILNKSAFSYCCWFRAIPGDTPSSNRAMIFGNNNPRQFSIFQYPTANDLHLSWSNDDYSTTNWSTVITGFFPSDTWVHLAITWNGVNGKIYKNGELVLTSPSITITAENFARDTQLIYNSAYHNISDIRLYNHCLSKKEVKEISKGLILHYKMMSMSGGENLVPNSYINTTSSTYGFSNRKINVESGKKYTLSVNGRISDEAKLEGTTLKAYLYKSDWSYCPLILSINTTENSTIIGTFTSTFTGEMNLTFYSYKAQSTAGSNVTVNWAKIEEGDKATSWSPNSADVLYNQLGYESNIEYDCSGFGNHGTKTSSITIKADSSKRYNSYLNFTTTDYICCGTNAKPKDALTANIWCYMSTWSADPHVFSCTEGGGWNFENGNGYIRFPVYYASSGYVHVPDKVTWASLSSGWHMLTGTFDGYCSKLYIDGQLESETTPLATKTDIAYNSSNGLFIHAEATGSATTPSTGYPACGLSDARIYSTALSADQVKELYEVSASVAKGDIIWAYEFIE